MIRNKATQLLFQSVYCVLAVIALLESVGYFAADFNESFYVYYTNLSNYICMAMMFVTLRDTYKKAKNKEDGYCSVAPPFTFMCVILIMVTFWVYNILLANQNTAVQYFTSLGNMLMHVILPIMYVANWILFYPHPSVKWYHPLLSVVMPLVYVAFIIVRATVITVGENTVVYPYFFLDADTLGWGGFFTWIAVLLAVFILLGYLIYGLERIGRGKKK